MRNRIKLLLLASLLVLCTLLVTSCDDSLTEPHDFRLNADTLELSWSKVPGAQSYVVEISGIDKPLYTGSNSYPLEELAEGKYTIKVKALGDGVATSDSDYGIFEFDREYETGLKYVLINNRSEYELIGGGSAAGDVVMESVYRGKPVTSIAEKALYNNNTITSFTVGENVRSIGSKAFSKCTVLTSVTMSDSVKTLGENLFQSSKMLESVTLSDSLTSIPGYTFSWCSALTEIEMGNKVKSIGDYAFSNCKELLSVDIPDALEDIGDYAFSDCIALTSLDLGSVKTLGEYAFCNCSAITEISLGGSLVEIGNRAFRGCKLIPSVTVPNTTVTIGHEAFYDCTALATVKFGTGVTDIGSGAFLATKLYEDAEGMVFVDGWVLANKDTEIDTLKLPEDTIGIAGYSFAKCNNLTEISIEGVMYVGDSAFHRCEQLMTVIADDSLLKVGNYAFANCELITEMRLGNSLESIGKYAFAGDTALENISLPDSLKSIGTYAFDNTKAFINASSSDDKVVYIDDWVVGFNYTPNGFPYKTDLVIRSGTKGIADYSFYMMESLQCKVYLPTTLEYLGRSVFYNTQIKSVFLSPSLKRIGDYAFYGCTNALFGDDGVTVIPEGVEYIGRSAFFKCAGIRSLSIPTSVDTIGDYAFYGCINLGSNEVEEENAGGTEEGVDQGNGGVTPAADEAPEQKQPNRLLIAEGVQYIGYRAFQGCESLTEIIIPNSVRTLGTHAFYKCVKLESATVGSGLDLIPAYTFYKCAALKSVTLPEGILSIGKYAFRGCEALTSIDLTGVTTVEDHAFNKCVKLSDVKISDALTYIGNYAFRGCLSIKSLTIPASVEYIGKHAFYGMNESSFYCEAQKDSTNWNSRFNTSYRPVFYGCEVSEEGYVESITVNSKNPVNPNAKNGITAPVKEGYDFKGWASSKDATLPEYTCENLTSAPENTKLYPVWEK